VSFIVFTGATGRLGALVGDAGLAKAHRTQDNQRRAHVLSPNVRDIIAKQQCQDNTWLAWIDQAISEGKERTQRIRCSISQLTSVGADTSATESVVATMVDNMRAHLPSFR
jgi:hypothetical protein